MSLTNAQVALLAAASKKYSITSFDAEVRDTLEAADRYEKWLDEHSPNERGKPEPPPNPHWAKEL